MYNKNDIYLFLLFSSLAAGGIGGSLLLPRILTIVFLPHFFILLKDVTHRNVSIIVTLLLCYLYLLISFFWTLDTEQGSKDLLYYLIHFITFVEIVLFAEKAKNPVKAIALGWVIAFFLSSYIALWEILTDNHLSIVRFDEDVYLHDGSLLVIRRFASAGYANFNGYSTFICFCLPFILYIMTDMKIMRKYRFLGLYCLLFAIYIVLFNASRGAIISATVILFIYISFSLHNDSGFNKNKLFFLLLILIIGFVLFGRSALENLVIKLSGTAMLDSSNREGVWGRAWDVFINSYCFGTGIGSLQAALQNVSGRNTIIVTHNMFLEILVQYGIICITVMTVFILKLFHKAFKMKKTVMEKPLLFSALVSLPISTIIDSTYLLNPSVWMLLASMYVVATYPSSPQRLNPITDT